MVVGVCYRPPDEEKVDEDFYRELEAASKLQVLVGALTPLTSAGEATQ